MASPRSRQERFVEVMSGQADGLAPAAIRCAASVGGALYSAAMRLRNRLYRASILKSCPLGRPTISVGNLSIGGTGKTVLVGQIADWLLAAGRRPAVLTRGYKGENSPVGSDEAAELRRLHPGLVVEADPDRVAAAARVLAGDEASLPDCFILDDGFQHRRAARGLDIVALDATMDLAGPLGRVLPRGLLREPISGLARADWVVITHADQPPRIMLQWLTERVYDVSVGMRVAMTRHAPAGLVAVEGDAWAERPLGELAGRRFVAFCGLGSPASFEATVGELGGECVGFVAFDDHHVYDGDELAELAGRARAGGAELLVTTTKDLAKAAAVAAPDVVAMLRAVTVRLEWLDGGEEPLRRAVLNLAR